MDREQSPADTEAMVRRSFDTTIMTETKNDSTSERFYCKNPFSNRCGKNEGIDKYNILCPDLYYTEGFDTLDECQSMCNKQNCHIDGDPYSGYFKIDDEDLSLYFFFEVRFMKLIKKYKLIDNTIENFNEQIRIFKELLKIKKINIINSSIDVDLGYRTWFSDTSIYLKNKQILLKIMNLEEEGEIKKLDKELWDDLNYKINLVVVYIIKYPNLIKLLLYNVRSPNYIMNSICSEFFFPILTKYGLGLQHQEFGRELPIQPHELLKSLSTEINNNSDKLINSLYAIFYESPRYETDSTERGVYLDWMKRNHRRTSVIDTEGCGIFQLIKLYILYFNRTELTEILNWYNRNSEILLPYFSDYEKFLIKNEYIVEDEEY